MRPFNMGLAHDSTSWILVPFSFSYINIFWTWNKWRHRRQFGWFCSALSPHGVLNPAHERWLCLSLPNSESSNVTLVVCNGPWWGYLYHGNRSVLQIRSVLLFESWLLNIRQHPNANVYPFLQDCFIII